MDIITGNRFLDIADLYFDGYKFINNDQVDNDLQIVFCDTHNLTAFFAAYIKYEIESKFILISHNSDGCIVSFKGRPCDFQFKEIDLPANMVAWYAQNMDVLSPKIRPLPIGLENFKWHNGKKWQEITQVSLQKISRNKMLYANFEVGTNPAERNACINALRNKPFVTMATSKVSYLEYISKMKQHFFVACPEGNGFDTHRLWECLYLGCIPIVRKRVFTQMLGRVFPMVLVDRWESVTIERLKNFMGNSTNYIQMMDFYRQKNSLSFSFWRKVVKGEIKIS